MWKSFQLLKIESRQTLFNLFVALADKKKVVRVTKKPLLLWLCKIGVSCFEGQQAQRDLKRTRVRYKPLKIIK